MGESPERTELADLLGQGGHAVGIRDVAGQADGALDDRGLQVDDDQVVGHATQPVDTTAAHAAGGSRDDGDAHDVHLRGWPAKPVVVEEGSPT